MNASLIMATFKNFIIYCLFSALHRENNRVLVLNSSELLSIIADDAEEMGLPRCMLTAFISPECIFTARMAQYFNVLPLLFPQLRIVAIDATIFSKCLLIL